MKQLRARDSAYVFLGGSRGISSRVLSCWVLAHDDGGAADLPADEVVDTIRRRLSVDERFTSRLMRVPGDLGHPYWVHDPTIDIAEQIVVDDRPGLRWHDAQETLADIAATPFDTDRPLWSMHLITNVTGLPSQPGLATILCVTFHHAAFDGMSWEKTMHRLLADTPSAPPEHVEIGPREASTARIAAAQIRRAPREWATFFGNLGRMLRETRQIARARRPEQLQYERNGAPRTRFNTGVQGRRWTDYLEFPLTDLQAVRDRVPGATVNDALLSIIGRTAHLYLTEHGEEPDASLVALVPMSTRGSQADENANQFVPLAIDVHSRVADIDTRLGMIATSSSVEKSRATKITRSEFWKAVNSAPALALRLVAQTERIPRPGGARKRPSVNTVVSNVINRTPVSSMMGVPTASGFAYSPLGGDSTLSHCVVTGLGKVMIVVTSDQTVMPDMTRYMQLLQDSVDAHQALIRRSDAG
ncbi:wax ester/triacylglycerol synthase domain-containing protein [Williamsia phyllosphaerae]|uniref:diacylglycerol O-acyltransferase n=1 Tax=Williamsia phyllosphaerae TaxID=885042 RepID=A0ABQ1UR81_9NOCA|nr:wax ester/triacylglycerol synthase domain-containing protein [Williamsia phyllosphaerae]GGF24577.1 putative diacyglycerol O-acyltransferase [Williamsia phyllosphaerae]